MKKFCYTVIFAGLTLLGTSIGANAMLIDFTSDDWSGLDGESRYSKTVAGIDVTIDGGGKVLTFNADDPRGYIDIPHLNGWGDGIGIIDDEVSYRQILTIAFSSSVTATNLYLLDLFDTKESGVQVSFNEGNTWNVFTTTVSPYGFADFDLSSYGSFNSISFMTTSSDYSVAGLNINPVPEPATMLLFGVGLLGLAGFKYKNRKK